MASDESQHRGGPRLPSVSVLIPTYRYRTHLGETIRAIQEDPGATEIIVIVDGCRDGSLELVQSIQSVDPRVVPMLVEHVGKSGALCAGLERATGDVVLLLDQDVVARPGLASGHAAHHRGADHLLVLGYMPTRTTDSDRRFDILTTLYADEYEAHVRFLERHPEYVLLRLWGGNVSLRREDCVRVGLDFRDFGHEDQDLGIRCLKAGLTGVFDRNLRAEHHHARDATQFLWYSKLQGASSWLIHEEHGDVVGPYDPDAVLGSLPTPVRWSVALLARSGLGDRTARTIAVLGGLCARARWRRGQSSAHRLARKIELRTGAVLAEAGDARSLLTASP